MVMNSAVLRAGADWFIGAFQVLRQFVHKGHFKDETIAECLVVSSPFLV